MTRLNYQRPEHILRNNRERELRISIADINRHGYGESNAEADSQHVHFDAISANEMAVLVPLVEALASLIEVQTSMLDNLNDSLLRANPLTRGKKRQLKAGKVTACDKEHAFEQMEDSLADYVVVFARLSKAAKSGAAKRQRDRLFKVLCDHPFSPICGLMEEPSSRMTQRIMRGLSSRH